MNLQFFGQSGLFLLTGEHRLFSSPLLTGHGKLEQSAAFEAAFKAAFKTTVKRKTDAEIIILNPGERLTR